jgi:hypothetical protein
MAEHRAAEAVKQWHSTGSDSTPKSISYNNVIPFAEPRHETFEIRQIVAIIGVAHNNNITAMRSQNPVPERRPIAAISNGNDPRALRDR